MVTNVVPGIPRGRGGWSAFRGRFIRTYLRDNGSSSAAEMHQAYKDQIEGIGVTGNGAPWRTATEKSFSIYVRMVSRLGLIERTGETEDPERDTPFLNRRVLWDLTDLGRSDDNLWINVQQVLYPTSPEKKREYSAAARGRKQVRRQRLKDLGITLPSRGRPRTDRDEAPAIEPELGPPAEPGPLPEEAVPEREELAFRDLEQIFNFVDITPEGNQDLAREILEALTGLDVDPLLITPVQAAVESPNWRGDIADRREAWLEFRGVVRTIRRTLELQGEL